MCVHLICICICLIWNFKYEHVTIDVQKDDGIKTKDCVFVPGRRTPFIIH